MLAAIDRDQNTVADYDIAVAIRLVTLKLVGYTEVVHTLAPRMGGDSAVVLFGGMAMARSYPGSTTVSTVNGGVTGMVRTLAVELAPIRVNAAIPASSATARTGPRSRTRSSASRPAPPASAPYGCATSSAPSPFCSTTSR